MTTPPTARFDYIEAEPSLGSASALPYETRITYPDNFALVGYSRSPLRDGRCVGISENVLISPNHALPSAVI